MAKVLVIDDSTELLDLFSILLSNGKFQIETAPCKVEGLEKLVTFKPDVVLLDVLLNGQNCRDFCYEIKQHKNTPVILWSADPELLKDFDECQAFGVIEKPFKMKTVTQKIEAALQRTSGQPFAI